MRRDGDPERQTGQSPYRAVRHATLRTVERVWHDLRIKDLHRSAREFELMHRALGFAALALLTLIPLLILVAAASPAPHRGLAGWVVYGMALTGSSADAVIRLFSAPSRVLGTTSVFSAVLLAVAGVSFAGSVQAGFEKIWGLPAGPWHKIWRQAAWTAVLIAYIYAEATVGTVTHPGLPETLARGAVAILLGIAFFWWGLRFLVGGRVSYLAAMPGAAATMVCLLGLRVFSGLVFEPLIARNAVSYGALGTVLIVQSWLIGAGWAVYGGQLFGRWFHDPWLRAWADSRRGNGEPGEQDSGRHNQSLTVSYPGRDQVGHLGTRAGWLLQVVVGLDEDQLLVRSSQRVIERTGIAFVDAGVSGRVDDQRRQRDASQVRRGDALRRAQAPHRQPRPQRADRADTVDTVVGLDRIAEIAPVRPPVGGLDGRVDHPQVSPAARDHEQPVPGPAASQYLELAERPVGNALVSGPLSGAVPGLEGHAERRPVGRIERIEIRTDGQRVGLVGHRRVQPVREHLRPAGVRRQRHEQVTSGQIRRRSKRPQAGRRTDAGLDRLGLVSGHERSAAGVAEKHDSLDAGQLTQPAHADADLRERVVEQEVRLVPAETGVPAEEAIAAAGQQGCQVMLGKVHVVVRSDERR